MCCFFNLFAICAISYLIYKYILKSRYEKRIQKVDSRSVLITGCDSGFGFRAALRFTDLGLTVFAGCYTDAGMEKLRNARPESKKLHVIPLDVTSDQSIEEARITVTNVLNQSNDKHLWAIINNAGGNRMLGPDEWMTVKNYVETLDLNFLGPVRMTHAFRPLIQKAQGRLVYTTSIQGRVIIPEGAPYVCSKFAMEAYGDAVRQEVVDSGVSVHIIEPGGFLTPHLDSLPDDIRRQFESLPSEVQLKWGQKALETKLEYVRSIPRIFLKSDTTPVIDAYVHAVLGKHPKCRYVVGSDAEWFIWISRMPECVQDAYWRWKLKGHVVSHQKW